MNSIRNIVIYKGIRNGIEEVKSCIFYEDGTVVEGSYDDGVKACEIVAKERKIATKDAMREMLNKEIIHVMSEEDFRHKYDSFLPSIDTIDIRNLIDDELEKAPIEVNYTELIDDEDEVLETRQDRNSVDRLSLDVPGETPIIETSSVFTNVIDNSNRDDEVVYEENYDGNYYEDFTDEYDDEIEDDDFEEEEVEYYEDNFANNAGAKLRENHLGVKILAIGLGLAIGAGIFCHCTRKSKEGEITNSTLPTTKVTDEVYGPTTADNTTTTTTTNTNTVVEYNNDLYNDYTFGELLNVTTNEFQKNSMINVSASLNGFNGTFASAHTESGNDIRAALSFEEIVALQQAYNNYSIEEVRAYFNGHEVNAIDMSNDYKNASLQLMGAYVIETRDNPVDVSTLIDSEEGREFYNRYHEMFLAAKEATGEEKLALVNEFYQAVREDFPITEEVRTEGISHADDHNSIEDYQLAVAPMIAAAEIMFQNLDTDYTLDTIENNISEIDFINDIGLCNHADDKFERLETIMLGAYEDNTNPLYDQYRNAIVNDLINRNEYVIDDDHRELANLRSFQLIVNGDNRVLGRNYTLYDTSTYVDTTTTYTDTNTWTDTSTSTTTTTTRDDTQNMPQEDRDAIDRAIDDDNNDARNDAQDAADDNARRIQDDEDDNARRIQDDIDNDDRQLQDDIDDANDKINDNNRDQDPSNDKPVNQNDFNGNVQFDDDHSDNNGNLDDSVQNITTDPSGANQDLPDPNDTEDAFEQRTAPRSYNSSDSYTVVTEPEEDDDKSNYSEYVDSDEGGAYIEYDDDYIPYDEDGNPIVLAATNEEAVDAYVEKLASMPENESGYQYTRTKA